MVHHSMCSAAVPALERGSAAPIYEDGNTFIHAGGDVPAVCATSLLHASDSSSSGSGNTATPATCDNQQSSTGVFPSGDFTRSSGRTDR